MSLIVFFSLQKKSEKKIFSALEEFFKKSSKFIPFNRFCAKKRQKALLFPEKINTFASRIKKKRKRRCTVSRDTGDRSPRVYFMLGTFEAVLG